VARRTDYRFAYTEQSWAEQRTYIDTALSHLDADDRRAADQVLSQAEVSAAASPDGAEATLRSGGWRADLVSATGGIAAIVAPDGTRIDGMDGELFGFTHESYDWTELQRHLDSYLQHRDDWAILDHDKPGLQRARTARTETVVPVASGTRSAAVMAMLPIKAHEEIGAPARCDIAIRALDDHRLEVTLTLRDKPANRMPEAGFLSITPNNAASWQFSKLGLWHDSGAIVRKGGGQLQAVDAVRTTIAGQRMRIDLLDAALVAPAATPFMPFQPERPNYARGLRVNLYNNKWGTNFPMWWEGDAGFRFILTLE
jgi:hypothetical protein